MIENRDSIFPAHSRKPFEKLIDRRSITQILEQGGDWDASISEDRYATHTSRVTLHSIKQSEFHSSTFLSD
jgi:hypothetical protein